MVNDEFSNFNSEAAHVFLDELSTVGYGLIKISLEKILDENYRAILSECEEAIVSCELIAAICGKPAADFPEDLNEWMFMFVAPGTPGYIDIIEQREKSADVLDKLVADSELRDFWDEDPHFQQWFDTQVDLQKRILG